MAPHRALPAGGATAPTPAALLHTLTSAAHATGGWPYLLGKRPRLEPTCWSVLALQYGGQEPSRMAVHAAFIAGCRRSSGLLSEHSDLAPNLAFNGLAGLVALEHPGLLGMAERASLFAGLSGTAGIRLEPSPHFSQDNRLRGWPWVADTFSWVEPTAWCVLALKKLRQSPGTSGRAHLDARIDEADALLLDRACPTGGWNYGNGTAFGQGLPAHIPTTALALIALQDRRDHPAVERGIAVLRDRARREPSGMGLSLTAVCLHLYGAEAPEWRESLGACWANGRFAANLCTTAIALYALTLEEHRASALRL